MLINAIKVNAVKPNDSLEKLIDSFLPQIKNNSILAITSKIISLCEGRVVKKSAIDKTKLIYEEADKVLKTANNPYGLYLTLKHQMLIPSAGIDESNAGDNYILYPKYPQSSAERIWKHLRKRRAKNVGVLITDSHSTLLRTGVVGCSLGWCGFKPLYSYAGHPDLFNEPLKNTNINILDALAAAAVLEMGEGSEQTPISLIQKPSKVDFVDRTPNPDELKSVSVTMEEDLYAPLFESVEWE